MASKSLFFFQHIKNKTLKKPKHNTLYILYVCIRTYEYKVADKESIHSPTQTAKQGSVDSGLE
jgi:hypothetical protein